MCVYVCGLLYTNYLLTEILTADRLVAVRNCSTTFSPVCWLTCPRPPGGTLFAWSTHHCWMGTPLAVEASRALLTKRQWRWRRTTSGTPVCKNTKRKFFKKKIIIINSFGGHFHCSYGCCGMYMGGRGYCTRYTRCCRPRLLSGRRQFIKYPEITTKSWTRLSLSNSKTHAACMRNLLFSFQKKK